MIFSAALSDAWNGLLEDAIADLAHLMQDGFESAMISNRRFVEGNLLLGRGMLTRLGFYFACQAPGPRQLWHYTTLSNPSQLKQLLFQTPVALLESAEGCGS